MKQNNFQATLKKVEADILSGVYRPRERLIESDLIERYGTKRGTVRKILKELEIKKYIEYRQNKGAIVSEPSGKEVRDIFHTRLILENSIVEQIITNMNDRILDRAIAFHKEFVKSADERDIANAMHCNMDFHHIIAEGSGNSIVTEIVADLQRRSYLWQFFVLGQSERLEKTISEHDGIIKAIKERDASGFQSINEQHLRSGYNLYMETHGLS